MFSSYQSLSFWAQTVYFLVLRGRRVGHPGQLEVRLLEQPGKILGKLLGSAGGQALSASPEWRDYCSQRPTASQRELALPKAEARLRLSRARARPGRGAGGRVWPGRGRGHPGAEEPGPPPERSAPEGPPPPPLSPPIPSTRCTPSYPPRAPAARLSITAQPPPADTGKAEVVGGTKNKKKGPPPAGPAHDPAPAARPKPGEGKLRGRGKWGSPEEPTRGRGLLGEGPVRVCAGEGSSGEEPARGGVLQGGGGADCRPDPAPVPGAVGALLREAPARRRPRNSSQTERLRCRNLRPSTAAPAGGGTPLTRHPEEGRLPEPQNRAAGARLPLSKPAKQRSGVPAVRRGSGGLQRPGPGREDRARQGPSREERSRPRDGTGTGLQRAPLPAARHALLL